MTTPVTILEYLQTTVSWLPEKAAFRDEERVMSFRQLDQLSGAVGTWLAQHGFRREPIAVCMERSPELIAAFLGIVRSGCFSVWLDPGQPQLRREKLLAMLSPRAILVGSGCEEMMQGSSFSPSCICFDTLCREQSDPNILNRIPALDADPVTMVFPSGPRGEPVGIPLTHRSLIAGLEHLGPMLGCSSNTVLGSQAVPSSHTFWRDLLLTLKYGGSCLLIPERCFSFPMRLMELLNEHRVDTICWPSSALMRISERDSFGKVRPETLKTIAFGGERMSARQLVLWQKLLPDVRFFQLYGMAETGGTCCVYPVTRQPEPGEPIPLGEPFPNTELMLLDDSGQPARAGEICIRGGCLSPGYFGDDRLDEARFAPMPGFRFCRERILHTGDYAARNKQGELILLGRKDGRFQHRGRRIEPGDIEAAAAACPGITSACCQYDEASRRIQLFFTGSCTCRQLTEFLQPRLPEYMLPRALYLLEFMPMTRSGTIDRVTLRKNSRAGVYGYEV